MKALSLRQPYAELIVTGQKTIELRKWNTKHRGIFLVHASKYATTLEEAKPFHISLSDLSFGALIGTVELVETKNYDDYDSSEWLRDAKKHLAGDQYRFSTKGFILKNPVKFDKPIDYKGQLQFFEVDDSFIKTMMERNL